MKTSELKEMIRQAMLAEIEEKETVEEGVWSALPARIPEFINAVEALKKEYYSVVGSDDVFNGLDQAISAAEELLMNTAEIGDGWDKLSEAKKDKKEVDVEADAEEIDVDTDAETEDTGEVDMEIGGDKGLKGPAKEIDDSLEAAIEAARKLGDEKLIDQIGNTITFFTRTHVVGKDQVTEKSVEEEDEDMMQEESINRFKKLAGIKE